MATLMDHKIGFIIFKCILYTVNGLFNIMQVHRECSLCHTSFKSHYLVKR